MSITPSVDLVLIFRSQQHPSSKANQIQESVQAKAEYTRLLTTLSGAGLKATGRIGVSQGQLLILVYAPWEKICLLVQNERHSDFLLGLPTASLPAHTRDFQTSPLSSAERIRLVHGYVTSMVIEGGLGIVPGSHDWPRLESVMALHDEDFNDTLIHAWTHRQIGFGVGYKELTKIRDQFGEAVALYFGFLSSYTKWLGFPTCIGVFYFMRGKPYDPVYSTMIALWSITFVEWWKIRERILSVRWGSYGSFRVEKRRPEFRGDQKTSNDDENTFPWWLREARIITSIPVIIMFAALLVFLLTTIFLLEAFVTQLYTGPGHRYASFTPTVLFVASVPRLLAVYHSSAVALTNWENHSHRSSHDYSLTVKTFTLSALVAYLGLGLSAFVYMPFYGDIMHLVRYAVSKAQGQDNLTSRNTTVDIFSAPAQPNPSRLQDQMFAFTVTNQVISFATEVILPFCLRKFHSVKSNGLQLPGKRKRVGFDDTTPGDKIEREFIENIRHQVELPEYTLFADYSEMATQFGYVSAWSTIWPLAPLSAFVNNWFELRGDALKIVKHVRRPLPERADTIGPWADALGFLTWMAALTNSALVYLFEARTTNVASVLGGQRFGTLLDANVTTTANLTLNATVNYTDAYLPVYRDVLAPALLIALSSSHAYILARLLLRHVLSRLFWKGSKEERSCRGADREIKRVYLRSLADEARSQPVMRGNLDSHLDHSEFWKRDDAITELSETGKLE